MKKLGILLLISFCLLGCQPRDEVPTPKKVSEIEISKSYTFYEQLRYEIVKSTVTNKIEPTNKNNTYRSIKPKQDENQFIDVVLKTKNLSKKEYVLKDIYQGTFVINHQSYKASLAIENLKYNQISQTDTLKEDEERYIHIYCEINESNIKEQANLKLKIRNKEEVQYNFSTLQEPEVIQTQKSVGDSLNLKDSHITIDEI